MLGWVGFGWVRLWCVVVCWVRLGSVVWGQLVPSQGHAMVMSRSFQGDDRTCQVRSGYVR
jgi:hypothetical protein